MREGGNEHGVHIKRSQDLPMEARIMREAKRKYVVIITFAKSRCQYSDEMCTRPLHTCSY
jgi:hypothetical protein